MLREAFQDLNRLRQIAAAVVRHGFGAYLERSRLREVLGREAVPPSPDGVPPPDRKTAARFRQLLAELGTTFIKLGQLLSTRPDLLPSHWVEELEQLQDSCPPVDIGEIREVIEEGLGKRIEDLFAELDPRPLASASIAQVHLARTHAGERVVVKVQRPHIRERIESDLTLLYYLARVVGAVIEETGVYTPTDIIEEFDRTIHEELDFSNEARNAKEMGAAAAKRKVPVIPRVFDELSSSTVLTLEYIEGTKLSDVTAAGGFDLERVSRNVIEAAFRQLFEDGLFHGDPHPGNILVLPGDGIALLDFGLVGRLGRAQQEALVTLIIGVALRDSESIARLLSRIGNAEVHRPIVDFRADIDGILERYLGLRLDEIRTATLLRDLLDLALRHRIRIPKEYAVLAKAAITIEGITRRLNPRLDILEVGLPYAKELLLARFNPGDASGLVLRSLLKLQGLAEDLPTQLGQILVDLESGKLRVNVASEAIDRAATQVRNAAALVFTGLVAAAFLVGGLVALALGGGHVTLLGGISLVAGMLTALGGLLLHLAPLHVRKVPLRRWLKR
ncbi:MAG TPA: AarF/ABC1/UbiB kinase family protein [Anaeromyxobacteraceae bacterium]|nr:AarF/ABC1/UbiB kinase family protein [Anaeromyxobacteraceae bacterium]